MVTIFSDDTLKERIKSGEPIVVDFWAEWCGPCRMLGSTIEELGRDYNGKVELGKLNIDTNPESSVLYGIRSIPTVLFFNNGELIEKLTGVAAKSVYVEKINHLIENKNL